MAVLTFSAAKQTTFTTPIEGTDNVGGLRITRASQTADASAVLTVQPLSITASVANSYGAYINAPVSARTGGAITVENAHGAYISSPSTSGSPAGTITNAYSLRLADPGTTGATLNYSLWSEGKAKVTSAIDTDSTTFALLNTNATTINFAGGATNALNIGASTGTTNFAGDVNAASGKTYKIAGTSVLSSTSLGSGVIGSSLTSVGTITTGTWNGTSIDASHGGTGLTSNPASGTLLYGSGGGALNTLAAGSNGQILLLSGGVPTWGTVPAAGLSGTIPIENGGTGSAHGSITGDQALTFTAGPGNNNVNLVPTGTGTVDVGGFRITSVGTPTQSGDAVNKSYVDTFRTGVDVKDSVHVATTTDQSLTNSNVNTFNIDGHEFYASSFTGSISGTTLTVSSVTGTLEIQHTVLGSGVAPATYIVEQLTGTPGKAGTYKVSFSQNVSSTSMTSGHRVLVKNNQTIPSENGVYVALINAWQRSWDMPSGITSSVNAGLFVFVEFGTVNANLGFVMQSFPGAVFVGSISGTTLTVTSTTSGTITAGQILTGTGISDGTLITADNGGGSYTVTPSQNVASGTITATGTANIGVSPISFSQFSGAGQIQAGTGIQKSGNTLSIDQSVVATDSNILNLTNKTYNGIGISAGGSSNKTLTVKNSLTLQGTDSSVVEFGGNFTTASTFSTTGTFSSGANFSTAAAFSQTGSGSLSITTGSSARSIGLSGNISLSSDFTTSGSGALTIDSGSTARTITLGGNITTGGSFSTTGTFSSGGNFSTGGTFSTNADFSQTGSVGLTINTNTTSAKTISLNGNLTLGANFSTVGTGNISIKSNDATRTIDLSGNITTNGNVTIGANFTTSTGVVNIGGALSTVNDFAVTGNGKLTIATNDADRTISLSGGITTGGALSTGAAFSTTGTGSLTLAGQNSATTITIPNSGSITMVDLSTAQTLSDKTLNTLVYGEFASQGTAPSAPATNNVRLYAKSSSLYMKNDVDEYIMLSARNAPYFTIGANNPTFTAGSYRRVGMYLLYGTTSDSTKTRLTSGGAITPLSSNVPTFPSSMGAVWFTKIYVTAWNNTDSGGAAWEISAVFRKQAGANSLVLLGEPVVISSADLGPTNPNAQTGLQITIDADVSVVDGSIDVSVNGLASKTIYWVVNIQTTEVG